LGGLPRRTGAFRKGHEIAPSFASKPTRTTLSVERLSDPASGVMFDVRSGLLASHSQPRAATRLTTKEIAAGRSKQSHFQAKPSASVETFVPGKTSLSGASVTRRYGTCARGEAHSTQDRRVDQNKLSEAASHGPLAYDAESDIWLRAHQGPHQRQESGGGRGDSVVTPFAGLSRANRETACTSVVFRKLGDAQYTKSERFPKLDVAGSSPVSRSTPSGTHGFDYWSLFRATTVAWSFQRSA